MFYYSTKIFVDKDTGEQLTTNQVEGKQSKYIIIKTKKNAITNYRLGQCKIEYTCICIRNPQQELQFK